MSLRPSAPEPTVARSELALGLPGTLARIALSALARRRRRVGVLGAHGEDAPLLLPVLDELGCEAIFLDSEEDSDSASLGRPLDLYIALHQDAVRTAQCKDLPALFAGLRQKMIRLAGDGSRPISVPVVCLLRHDEIDVDSVTLSYEIFPPTTVFAPILVSVMKRDGEVTEIRPILEDGLALSNYMEHHREDAGPLGRPLECDDALDLMVLSEQADTARIWESIYARTCVSSDFRGFTDVPEAVASFDAKHPGVLVVSYTQLSPFARAVEGWLRQSRPGMRRALPRILAAVDREVSPAWFSVDLGIHQIVGTESGWHREEAALRNAARMCRAFQNAGAR